jgi:uncharacterized protein (TIGR02594 family)
MTDSLRDPLAPFNLALKELGQAEIPGPANNKRIVYYHSFTDLKATTDKIPWCSSFMCAMAELAGFKSTRSAKAKSWIDYGAPGMGRAGDIAVFTRPGGGHVAFVYKDYQPGSSLIFCLGGNQDDKVCVKSYSVSRLLAFRSFK